MSIDPVKFAERIEMAVAQAPASSHSLVMEARDALLLAAALRLAESCEDDNCYGEPVFNEEAYRAFRAARGDK